MIKTVNITATGKKELEAELATLIAQRPAIAREIATARDFGDLKENEEYSAARAKQNRVESRILEIQDILREAKVIKIKRGGKITLGSHVKLKLVNKLLEYTIVGPIEANPLEGKISDQSPLGQALMGKKEGDVAELATPKGKALYKILEVA
jgi:transcription elongation factor GreA